MSIWTKPLFGKEPRRTPASAVSVRCARIIAASGYELLGPGIGGYLLGTSLFFAELMLALAWRSGAYGMPFVEALFRFLKDVNPSSALVAIAAAVVFVWLLPRIGRFAFDYRARSMTREGCVRQRRMRRRSRTIVTVIFILLFMLLAIGAIVGPWEASALGGAKFAAAYGLSLAAMGLRSRRGRCVVCARCDYPMKTWRGAPPRCPECGNPWHENWRARIGQRAVRWRWVVIGLGLVALSAILAATVGRWGL